MKFTRFFQILAVLSLMFASCNPYKIDIPSYDQNNNKPGKEDTTTPGTGNEEDDNYPVKYPDPKTPKVKTLQVDGFFTVNTIKEGITLYSAEKKKEPLAANDSYQTIFVLEVDLNNDDYKVDFLWTSSDTVSAIAKRHNAIAAVNACYELEAIYCKTKGNVHGEVTLEPDHLRFWKHEAAIVSDGKRKIGIVDGSKGTKNHKDGGIQAINMYKSLSEPNIFASAPMLIDDYDPVGATYVPEFYTSKDLQSLDGEDWRRHQGVRHPRVAAALTDDNDLLLVVVDGRFSKKAEGMTCKELTNFLVKYFNPRWAINMDGGGSSTMYIKGYGDPVNNVLNYPTDNDKWDHYGQRKRPSLFVVKYDE